MDEMLKNVRSLREDIRNNRYQQMTSGLAPGMVQGNVVILPASDADDFKLFCNNNPKPCPLIGVGKPGNHTLAELGEDIDIRRDVPRYLIYRNGQPLEEVPDIMHYWQDDFVSFVLGCSYSFENALANAGFTPRNVSEGKNVSMYRTNIDVAPGGKFKGKMVVSMRPYTPRQAIEAIAITSKYPRTHGSPVHFGNPTSIGIKDINQPDFGDPISIRENEVPVFWACGVTPQLVLEETRPPLCITHKPGFMLITDRFDHEFED